MVVRGTRVFFFERSVRLKIFCLVHVDETAAMMIILPLSGADGP